ncbi:MULTISPECIES: N-acetyltransferase [Bacteroides]|uniref:GNAT family N-acetyltransferase n=1 Tax=Bacteroides TaxID=816 RepID=UPI001897F7F4|nr:MULTISPECIES: N-acetyltransferase [Bacteroides]
MEIKLRLEEEKDYRQVEEVTREAFWNVYAPGCDDHLLVHKLRENPQFIKALDYVATHDDKIVGHIIYVESKIIANDGTEHKTAAFGPISVLPEYQHKGVGSKLITHTAKLAKEMGYPAIVIYGEPEYYKRFGFKLSKEYKITNQDKKYPAAMQVWELYPNALKGIEGTYDEGGIYETDPAELLEFEKGFPVKEKKHTKTQERFLEMVSKFI